MIDDHVKNLSHFNGEKLLFTATHNMNMLDTGYRRVNNWEEVRRLFIAENVCCN
jgi:5'(3')-deoxyribonucleotidase